MVLIRWDIFVNFAIVYDFVEKWAIIGKWCEFVVVFEFIRYIHAFVLLYLFYILKYGMAWNIHEHI